MERQSARGRGRAVREARRRKRAALLLRAADRAEPRRARRRQRPNPLTRTHRGDRLLPGCRMKLVTSAGEAGEVGAGGGLRRGPGVPPPDSPGPD